jgi:DHA2 family multidrug resistance protein
VLTQGDRLDWFNSPLITFLTLTAAASIPLLVLNEWFQKVPFLKIQMLGRRNLAFGALGLFLFILSSLGSLELPAAFLREAQGFRPSQTYDLTLLVALSQVVLLPATAFLLDKPSVDARLVAIGGLALTIVGLWGDSFVNTDWQASQFLLCQICQAVGAPLVVMPLLMLATNAVVPEEGPFAAALINTPRALAELTAVWLVGIIERWRGAFHTTRLVDSLGQYAFAHPPGSPGGLTPTESYGLIMNQAAMLTTADAFRIVAAIASVMLLITLALPKRSYPPRIALVQGGKP